jgi:hypothetical protein
MAGGFGFHPVAVLCDGYGKGPGPAPASFVFRDLLDKAVGSHLASSKMWLSSGSVLMNIKTIVCLWNWEAQPQGKPHPAGSKAAEGL